MTLKWLPMPADSLGNEKAFTLVEVMIAISIFAIGFLAVASLQTDSLMRTNSSRQATEAWTFAEAQVEQLRSLPFYDPDEDLDNDGTVENFDIVPELRAGINHPDANDNDDLSANTPYTINWTVTDNVPLPAYDLNVLSAGGGETRSKTIRVWVTKDNQNEIQAEIIFAKFWAADTTL